MSDQLAAFQRLLDIMDDLREKCPWDRKQTIKSLRPLTLEETYELIDAIDNDDFDGLKEEIGDLMLHMVFYAKIAKERGEFDIATALNAICDKLVERHPHIYGDVQVNSEEDVKRNWEQIKLNEGKKSILQGVPSSLPALVKAHRIQNKVKQVGFEWKYPVEAWEKVVEELGELRSALETSDSQAKKEEEFGDVLFALVNYARYHNIDPEAALAQSNNKFKRRFEYIEDNATTPLLDMTLEQMDALWDEAKGKGL